MQPPTAYRVPQTALPALRLLHALLFGDDDDGYTCVTSRQGARPTWTATSVRIDDFDSWYEAITRAYLAGYRVRLRPSIYTDAVAGPHADRAEGRYQPLRWTQQALVFRWPTAPPAKALDGLHDLGGRVYGIPGALHVGLVRLDRPKPMPAYVALGTEFATLLGAEPFAPSWRIPVPGFGSVRFSHRTGMSEVAS